MDCEEAKAEWGRATSFRDLCELTARFIEGDLPFVPYGSYETVDEETNPLIPYLTALNRAGFMTIDSQPGMQSTGWKQRATVDGYALEPVAKRIARSSLYTDLHIVVAPPKVEIGFHTPVIVRDFMPHGWGGFSNFDLEHFSEVCSLPAMRELEEAWSVSVIDLQWGRESHLWHTLARELCYSERPRPDLQPDLDFIY